MERVSNSDDTRPTDHASAGHHDLTVDRVVEQDGSRAEFAFLDDIDAKA